MFKNEDDFAKLVGKLEIDTDPRPGHHEELRQRMLSALEDTQSKDKTFRLTWPGYRRSATQGTRNRNNRSIMMRNRIVKLAAVAAVAAAIVLAVTFTSTSHNGPGTVWAIEQTIAALEQVETAYFKVLFANTEHPEEPLSFEAWYRAVDDPEKAPVAFVFRIEGQETKVLTDVGAEGLMAIGDKKRGMCKIPLDVFAVYDGPDYLQSWKEKAGDWKEEYGQDEVTGAECVFVTFSFEIAKTRYWFWIQIDRKTELPMRFRQWDNAECKGTPRFAINEIAYGVDAEDAFKITEHTMVVRNPNRNKVDTKKKSNPE